MAWKKYKFRRTPDAKTPIVSLVREHIKIPQPPESVLDIGAKDLIKTEYVNSREWWFTKHRRGVYRPKVGEDPLERRAIPKSVLRGTLPERIVFKFLVDKLRMVEGVDFTFQSSQSGGRIELGGIVVDFLFPEMKLIIQVQGPTHDTFLRAKKDIEQVDILTEMGYRVFEITDDMIYNEYRFDGWMRSTFNLGGVGGGTGNSNVSLTSSYSSDPAREHEDQEEINNQGLQDQIISELNAIGDLAWQI